MASRVMCYAVTAYQPVEEGPFSCGRPLSGSWNVNSALVLNDTQPRHPNAPKRFQTATKGLDDVRFRLFDRPAELHPIVEKIDRMYRAQPDPKP